MSHVRHTRFLILLLLLSSLFGYLEWGQGSHTFLFQAEVELFRQLFRDPASAVHPFTVLPLLGQILLLLALLRPQPSRALVYAGIAGIGLLLVLMLAIGLMQGNIRILASTLPFVILAVLTIRQMRRMPSPIA